MNIKIATFFFGNNYGALLQCFYLKKFIKENFEKKKVNFFRYQPKELIFREEYSPIIKKNPLKVFDGLVRFRRLRKWKKDNISSKFTYQKTTSTLDKEISIYGSDEIWNFANPFFGYDNYFFGKYDENYKISYAASFGSAKAENLNSTSKEEIKKLINKFSFLSVRDESSWKILNSEFNFKSEIVLDPTFLINENHLLDKKKDDGKICIIYGNFFSKKQIEKIINYCKSNKLKILSVGYYNEWAKNNVTLNPFEFLDQIKRAKIIFTSMFHGIQFSVKFKKNFWFSVDPYRVNKLEYFLEKLNLKKRTIEDNSNFQEEIDYIKIEDKLNKWKKFSEEYLLNSINFLDKSN